MACLILALSREAPNKPTAKISQFMVFYNPVDNTNTYRISKLCHIETSQALSYFFFGGGVSACSEFCVKNNPTIRLIATKISA